jgi:hypothetical protein
MQQNTTRFFCKEKRKRGRPRGSRKKQDDRLPLPDLRAWWRAMRPWEGKYAKPRPEWLTV